MPRADFKEKREARIDGMLARADKITAESNRLYEAGHKELSQIPFGQPILVGHHSEKRDRAFRARNVGRIEKSFELSNKASHLRERAAAAESNNSISSDDPEAVVLLKEKLDGLEAKQKLMKDVNAAYRRYSKKPESLDKAKIPEEYKEAIRNHKPEYSWQENRIFERYELSNNNANIKRVKGRIKELEAHESIREDVIEGNGWKVLVDKTDNRVYVDFPGKPSAEVRTYLKRHGFRWTPSVGKWGRLLNGNGLYAGREVAKWLKKSLGERSENG